MKKHYFGRSIKPMAYEYEGRFSGEDNYHRFINYARSYVNKAENALAKNNKRPYRVYWNPRTANMRYTWNNLKSMTFTTLKEAVRKAGRVRMDGASQITIRVWNTETKTWSTYNG